MNLRERLQIRALINLIISVIERLVAIFEKVAPKNKIDVPDEKPKPNRPRPLKKVVDTIDNIIPFPWRNK
jgi:hypothetical protein